ncbi:unnamed protein product [Didymodactylos carnosus]|uniref:Kelch repeat-containing protein n=1 Tax=Didymodactylos carnosus TaxID=1234261 RepID=A0A815NHF9_9BILA|nr:unnamed protein product [Didymodactylos carnosus]CAF1434694.1 unnamed protein product [Didymodactylos carnosus]CAF3798184.1 unnamed protein product [Didymodactylos carnosus]CAF4312429.1 unnamed protein product [Didymodactylos carnosus]
MVVARVAHTSTFIPETNSVLITGGDSNNLWIGSPSTETFLSSNGSSALGRNMTEARFLHTADHLGPHEILIAGGSNTSNAEVFDPLLGITNRTVIMSAPRIEHKSALIDYGGVKRVLLMGGYYGVEMDISPTGEVYDNVTDTFKPVNNNMSSARVGHTATAIPNGTVVIAGGFSETFTPLDSIEVYSSASNIFVPLIARLSHARGYHTATYIPSIQAILFTGGEFNYTSSVALQTYELFDILSLTIIRNGTLLDPKTGGTATLLLNGEVLLVEGYDGFNDTITCELYNPMTDLWRAAASLNMARDGHTATLLENSGQVLICGGVIQPSYSVLDECELYHP